MRSTADPRRDDSTALPWHLRWARSAWAPRPTPLARLLQPVSWPYAALAALHRGWWRAVRRPARLPVPVVVVGNLVAGGAGKTPVVIALVAALRTAGWTPGVVSRGHGRSEPGRTRLAEAGSTAAEIGDEPLLIHRRSGAPVAVGARRADAARLLLARHPEVDIVVADDGLQHHALAHDAAIVVFDERGAGNGLLLPAGPLREALPATLPPHWLVLYSGRGASTTLPGTCVQPQATRAVPLAAWWRGDDAAAVPLAALAALEASASTATPAASPMLTATPLRALAGIGDPAKFFATLAAAGLAFSPQPMPDHARYERAPWPPGTAAVVTTEKDAVKLAPEHVGGTSGTSVWVVPLDLTLPPQFVAALLQRLPPRRGRR